VEWARKSAILIVRSRLRNIILAATYRLICDRQHISRFCDLYRRWLKKLDLVLRQEHRAGEKMFVDYAGATIPIHSPETGEAHPAAVFVAVLGASSYTFAEATTGQDLRNWMGSHMRA
jgi:transposase